MPSSISNSDRGNERRSVTLHVAIIALLTCSIALIAILEIGTRAFIHTVSKNLSRIHHESIAASQMRGATETQQQLLLLGNSLLLEDVNMIELDRNLQPERSAARFAIQSTTYYDWYYGLRGLLAGGAHPDSIVLCFEPRHVVLPGVQQEMFAYYLMQRQDLMNISRTLRLTATETFDLLLANTSMFYALRKDIRQVLLQRLLPDLPQLTSMFAFSPKPPADPSELRAVGKDRLTAIRDLAASAQIQFTLLLMPPFNADAATVLREIGQEISVPVLIPLKNDQLERSDYGADGYHLSESGREKFTNALIPLLRDIPIP